MPIRSVRLWENISMCIGCNGAADAAHSPACPCPTGHLTQAGPAGRCALLQIRLVGERMSQTITVWKVSPMSLVK